MNRITLNAADSRCFNGKSEISENYRFSIRAKARALAPFVEVVDQAGEVLETVSVWTAEVGHNAHGLTVSVYGRAGAKWTPDQAIEALHMAAGAVGGYLSEHETFVQVRPSEARVDRHVVAVALQGVGIRAA